MKSTRSSKPDPSTLSDEELQAMILLHPEPRRGGRRNVSKEVTYNSQLVAERNKRLEARMKPVSAVPSVATRSEGIMGLEPGTQTSTSVNAEPAQATVKAQRTLVDSGLDTQANTTSMPLVTQSDQLSTPEPTAPLLAHNTSKPTSVNAQSTQSAAEANNALTNTNQEVVVTDTYFLSEIQPVQAMSQVPSALADVENVVHNTGNHTSLNTHLTRPMIQEQANYRIASSQVQLFPRKTNSVAQTIGSRYLQRLSSGASKSRPVATPTILKGVAQKQGADAIVRTTVEPSDPQIQSNRSKTHLTYSLNIHGGTHIQTSTIPAYESPHEHRIYSQQTPILNQYFGTRPNHALSEVNTGQYETNQHLHPHAATMYDDSPKTRDTGGSFYQRPFRHDTIFSQGAAASHSERTTVTGRFPTFAPHYNAPHPPTTGTPRDVDNRGPGNVTQSQLDIDLCLIQPRTSALRDSATQPESNYTEDVYPQPLPSDLSSQALNRSNEVSQFQSEAQHATNLGSYSNENQVQNCFDMQMMDCIAMGFSYDPTFPDTSNWMDAGNQDHSSNSNSGAYSSTGLSSDQGGSLQLPTFDYGLARVIVPSSELQAQLARSPGTNDHHSDVATINPSLEAPHTQSAPASDSAGLPVSGQQEQAGSIKPPVLLDFERLLTMDDNDDGEVDYPATLDWYQLQIDIVTLMAKLKGLKNQRNSMSSDDPRFPELEMDILTERDNLKELRDQLTDFPGAPEVQTKSTKGKGKGKRSTTGGKGKATAGESKETTGGKRKRAEGSKSTNKKTKTADPDDTDKDFSDMPVKKAPDVIDRSDCTKQRNKDPLEKKAPEVIEALHAKMVRQLADYDATKDVKKLVDVNFINQTTFFLPEAVTPSVPLSLHILTNNFGRISCLSHLTSSTSGVDSAHEVCGTAYPPMPKWVGIANHQEPPPDHIHCGCSIEDALLNLFFYKTTPIRSTHPNYSLVQYYRGNHIKAGHRALWHTCFKNFTGLELKELLMRGYGTAEWEIKVGLIMLYVQHERLRQFGLKIKVTFEKYPGGTVGGYMEEESLEYERFYDLLRTTKHVNPRDNGLSAER